MAGRGETCESCRRTDWEASGQLSHFRQGRDGILPETLPDDCPANFRLQQPRALRRGVWGTFALSPWGRSENPQATVRGVPGRSVSYRPAAGARASREESEDQSSVVPEPSATVPATCHWSTGPVCRTSGDCARSDRAPCRCGPGLARGPSTMCPRAVRGACGGWPRIVPPVPRIGPRPVPELPERRTGQYSFPREECPRIVPSRLHHPVVCKPGDGDGDCRDRVTGDQAAASQSTATDRTPL